MTRQIEAVALGTYYKVKSPHAGPNADPIRGLVWWAKNNRPGKLTTVWQLNHPRHPSKVPCSIGSPEMAYAYAADVFAGAIASIRATLKIEDTPFGFVPLPTSSITAQTLDAARWPALKLAEQLAARGLGAVRICLANKQPLPPKHEQPRDEPRRDATLIAENLVRIARLPRGEHVFYVDDLITWGETVAAADYVLAPGRAASALALGFTDSETRDAYTMRRRVIGYSERHDDGKIVLTTTIVNPSAP